MNFDPAHLDSIWPTAITWIHVIYPFLAFPRLEAFSVFTLTLLVHPGGLYHYFTIECHRSHPITSALWYVRANWPTWIWVYKSLEGHPADSIGLTLSGVGKKDEEEIKVKRLVRDVRLTPKPKQHCWWYQVGLDDSSVTRSVRWYRLVGRQKQQQQQQQQLSTKRLTRHHKRSQSSSKLWHFSINISGK